jgi:hypothetical protein
LKVLNPPFVGSTPARGGFLLKCTFGCAVTVVDGGKVDDLDVDSTAVDSTAIDIFSIRCLL